jgi:hypothetical protein
VDEDGNALPSRDRLVRTDDVTLAAQADAWMRDNHPDVDFPALVGTVRGISWEQVTDTRGADEGSDHSLPYVLAQHRTDLGGGFVDLAFPIGSHERSDHRTDGNRARTNPDRGWNLSDAIGRTSEYAAARPLKRRPLRVKWNAPTVRRTDPTYVEGDEGKRGSHRRTRRAILVDSRGRTWTAGNTPVDERGNLVTYSDRTAVRTLVPRREVRDDAGKLVELSHERTAVRTGPPIAYWRGLTSEDRASTVGTREVHKARRAAVAREARDAIAVLPQSCALADAFHALAVGESTSVDLPQGGTVRFTRGASVTRYTWTSGEHRSTWTSRTPVAAALRLATLGA